MIPLEYYLYLSSILFAISLTGIILHRKNIISLLMCIELLLLAANTNFIAFSESISDIVGQIFVFFVLTVAAAEAAIGLAIILLIYRQKNNIDVQDLTELKG
ncbi:MAG: NADH-quinone oxidoreductase subunit NuoK [Legionellales bacterium]|nr:NADH-quinone oxidoreductase subunit NuoK [Legionellales bacterium]